MHMTYYNPETDEVLSLHQIVARHSNVSFPKKPSDKAMAQLGYYPAEYSKKPKLTDPETQEHKKGKPRWSDGKYIIYWLIADKSPEAIRSKRLQAAKSKLNDPVMCTVGEHRVEVSNSGTCPLAYLTACTMARDSCLVMTTDGEIVSLRLTEVYDLLDMYTAEIRERLLKISEI